MKIQNLNEIIDKRKEELIYKGYSYSFYRNLTMYWSRLLKYLTDNKLDFNEESKSDFIKMQKEITNRRHFNYIIHAVNAIDGLDKVITKKNASRILKREINYNHSDENQKILDSFIKEISDYNKKRTVCEKKCILNQILTELENIGINDCTKINRDLVNQVKDNYLKFDLYSTRKRYQWVFKDFLKYLYNNHYVDINFSFLFDKFQTPNVKLPTIWSNEDLEKIVNALNDDTTTDIRNKTMLLLIIRLGIRFIDIKNLKFENINWKENKICFVQEKTNKYLELPLPEEVGLAIINYIKNARPQTKEKYIFVTFDQYHKKLSNSYSLSNYLIDIYEKAGIDYKSKSKKGIHTFRHTFATDMLESGIPLDIISSTLGHANKESTKVYLGVGYNLLKECCLNIPEVLR